MEVLDLTRPRVGSIIGRTVLTSGNIFVGTLGLVVGIVPWFYDPLQLDTVVKVGVTIVVILSYVIVVLVRSLILVSTELRISPRVLRVLPAQTRYTDAIAILLIEPNGMLTYESVLTVFVLDEGFERPIGIGKIVNVQDDRKMQAVAYNIDSSNDAWEPLLRNLTAVERAFVKPAIPESIWLERRS